MAAARASGPGDVASTLMCPDMRKKLFTAGVLAQIPHWMSDEGLGPVDIALSPRERETTTMTKTLVLAAAVLVLSVGAASALNCFGGNAPRRGSGSTGVYKTPECPSGRMIIRRGDFRTNTARTCNCVTPGRLHGPRM